MKEGIQYIIVIILLTIPMISEAQLNESVLDENIEAIKNEDFRRTVEEDLDNWDIEYESDSYYEPDIKRAYTFLGFPISSASFFLSENGDIEKFGLRVTVDDGDEFYQRMFDEYGSSSVCSPSGYFFEKYGITLPKEESEEALKTLSKVPMPTVEDYKDTNSITWSKIKRKSLLSEIDIKIYNSPLKGYGFESPQRNMRILFKKRNGD